MPLEAPNNLTITNQTASDPQLWRRIDAAAEAGRALSVGADSLVRSLFLNDESERGATYSQAVALARQVPVELRTLILGDYQVRPRQPHDSNRVLWTLLRAAIADQFSGFTFRNDAAPKILKEHGFYDDSVPNAAFWSLPSQPQHKNPARLWFLIAYVNLLEPEYPPRKLAVDSLRGHLDDFFHDVRKQPIGDAFGNPIGIEAVRWCAVYRLAKASLRDLKIAAEEQYTDEQLFAQLQQRLGSYKDAGVEISLLLRALRGRYVTGMSSCPSWWTKQFGAGVRHVLETQGDDGRWHVSTGPSPLLHEYSPLLHVLDLSMDVLRHHAEALTTAAERALASATARLDQAEEDCERFKQNPRIDLNALDVFDCITAALSLGDVVYDRLRDLLSELILDDLGARDVSTEHRWDDMTKTLRFQETLKAGVIEPWKQRSPRRPGAILVFGPPGTGKTTCAEILASELEHEQQCKAPDSKWKLLSLTPADFAREGSDKIVAQAERIFRLLHQVRRCVVLMDEMEEFLRTRSGGSDRESRLVTTSFLPLLQEVVSSREIILIVATNFVGRIDPAITRQGRFDLILPLGPPHKEGRLDLLKKWAGEDGHPVALVKVRYLTDRPGGPGSPLTWEQFLEETACYTMGYTPSEMVGFLGALEELELGPTPLTRNDLRLKLWRVRADNMPMALSNRAGCSWTVFADEVRRYARPSIGSQDDEGYWDEPKLPLGERATT
jgi:ATPase family associated with various cellular activities (AAA)